MIISESVMTTLGDIELSRQKDKLDSKWYGLMLSYTNKEGNQDIADNGDWIVTDLFTRLLEKDYRHVKNELNVEWDKDTCKRVRKIFKTADKLSWFDSYK